MPRRLIVTCLAALFLALMFVLAGGAALRESVTFDEVAHIGAGVSYLQKLDMRYNEEHPPLAKIIATLPLVIHGVQANYTGTIWRVSDGFFSGFLGEWIFGEYLLTRWNSAQSVLQWTRVPMLLVTVALGWLVFRCALRLGGDWGGLLCVTVYAMTPTFLVFGPLVLTDIPITFFSLLALWAIADLWDSPDGVLALRAGLALGAAILTKFTAPLLFLAFIAVSLSTRWIPMDGQPASKDEARRWRRVRWRAMWRAIGWATLVVYAAYFILSWNQPMDIPGLASHGRAAAFFGRLLMPPWLVLRGLLLVVVSGNRPTFLLGHAYPHGVWFYFPVVFILKSPPGFLGLLAALVVAALIAQRLRRLPVIPAESATLWRVLWVSLAVFSAICIVSHFDVSVRHFTIPLVLLILLLAPLPRLLGRLFPLAPNAVHVSVAVVMLLAASCVVTAIRAYPYFMPYLNPLFRAHPTYWLGSDSNVDWNQALPDVAKYAAQHGLTDIPIDIYGMFASSDWVPGSRLWDCQAPAARDAGLTVVISSNNILDAHNCGWLMQYPHEALAAGSMYAIQLPRRIPRAGTPGGPPAVEMRYVFLHAPFEMREVFQRIAHNPEAIPQVMSEIQAAYTKRVQ